MKSAPYLSSESCFSSGLSGSSPLGIRKTCIAPDVSRRLPHLVLQESDEQENMEACGGLEVSCPQHGQIMAGMMIDLIL